MIGSITLDGKLGGIGFLWNVFTNGNQFFVEFNAVYDGVPQGFQLTGLLVALGNEFYDVFIYADFHNLPFRLLRSML
jgi:hypothetical protein